MEQEQARAGSEAEYTPLHEGHRWRYVADLVRRGYACERLTETPLPKLYAIWKRESVFPLPESEDR